MYSSSKALAASGSNCVPVNFSISLAIKSSGSFFAVRTGGTHRVKGIRYCDYSCNLRNVLYAAPEASCPLVCVFSKMIKEMKKKIEENFQDKFWRNFNLLDFSDDSVQTCLQNCVVVLEKRDKPHVDFNTVVCFFKVGQSTFK